MAGFESSYRGLLLKISKPSKTGKVKISFEDDMALESGVYSLWVDPSTIDGMGDATRHTAIRIVGEQRPVVDFGDFPLKPTRIEVLKASQKQAA
jgi:hypothetical protein